MQFRHLKERFWSLIGFAKPEPPAPASATPDPPSEPEPAPAADLPEEVLWLLDAPMFIDEKQVEAFYDAVLRPDYEQTSLTLSDSVSSATTIGGSITVGAAIPWLAKADTTGKAERSRGSESGQESTLKPIVNPYRHLVALTIHYSTEKGDRLVLHGAGGESSPNDWQADAFIAQTPRALALLDLPPGTKLIPAAMELLEGGTVELFDDFAKALRVRGGPPEYPGSRSSTAERDAYWQWYADNFSAQTACEVIEKAAADSHIAWIAYRVPLGPRDTGPFLHLHAAPRGGYETGVFAYNFVKRGFKHGIRLVGTLKSEPDLNVLAVFER